MALGCTNRGRRCRQPAGHGQLRDVISARSRGHEKCCRSRAKGRTVTEPADMTTPVTHGQLRDYLASYPTRAEIHQSLASYPAAPELRKTIADSIADSLEKALARYPTRDEIASFATKTDFEIWSRAWSDQRKAEYDAEMAKLHADLNANLNAELNKF